MKKFLAIGILSVAFFPGSFSQNNCDGYFPFEQGLFFQHTHYDAKGKVTTVSTSTIDLIEAIDKGYKAQVRRSLVDDKGKVVSVGEYSVRCLNGVIHMDVNSMLNPSMTEAYQSMEMTLLGDGFQIPENLSVGQELPKGNTINEVTSKGLPIMTMNFEVLDRKVEARENISTPIGHYDCYKIRETINTQAMFLTRSFTSVSWYSKHVGLVRQETYDQKGKLSSWMELTGWGME